MRWASSTACVLGAEHAGRPGEPRRLSQGAGRLLLGATRQALRGQRDRLQRNPLRILDSKDEGDKAIKAGAPSFADHLNQASRDFFSAVKDGLAPARRRRSRSIPRLVRGLDYYTHTAFEFVTTHIGAQGTVLGGGRYDGLIAELGGPPTRRHRLGRRHRAAGHAVQRAGAAAARRS